MDKPVTCKNLKFALIHMKDSTAHDFESYLTYIMIEIKNKLN
jgi:hypothetical protein